eukprot:TRINITY_DN7515_c0_g1_i1.p3 TRINITY_DN7515_c0_g1~~TRINITY_DN7515_c0_g1_i1.p3  ORF type:complete len:83 (+),score=18.68 TRINITY_DN7515_c0_g1_i1:165-413(+)
MVHQRFPIVFSFGDNSHSLGRWNFTNSFSQCCHILHLLYESDKFIIFGCTYFTRDFSSDFHSSHVLCVDTGRSSETAKAHRG